MEFMVADRPQVAGKRLMLLPEAAVHFEILVRFVPTRRRHRPGSRRAFLGVALRASQPPHHVPQQCVPSSESAVALLYVMTRPFLRR
jgi:hypothetical protein